MGACNSLPTPEDMPKKIGYELKPEYIPAYDASQGPFYVTSKTAKRPVVYAPKGIGSQAETPTMTFSKMFEMAASSKGSEKALLAELPLPPLNADGTAPPALPLDQWKAWTYKEFYDECFDAAKALISLGANEFDGSIIYGANSPYWIMAKMASILSTVIPAGIYPTDTLEQIAYKAQYADAVVAFCDDEAKLATFSNMVEDTKTLKVIVVWGHTPATDKREITRGDGSKVKIMTWEELRALGSEQGSEPLNARLESQDATQCCMFCFTSGTTGKPKAVMLSHDNVTFQARGTVALVPQYGKKEERGLSYLPLSHVAGVITDIVLPIATTAVSVGFTSVYFARPYDLKAGSLGDRLRAVRPTAFLGVPRVWEKIAEKMRAAGAATKGLKKKVATFAKTKGAQYLDNCMIGGTGQKPPMYDFAEKKVLNKVKEALGLDACIYAVTGAAPMSADLQRYFGSLGIAIMDTYGMSECCGQATGNIKECFQFGSVGQTFAGTEVRVFHVDENNVNVKTEAPRAKDPFHPTEDEQGELCYRGRHIMMGYYANPSLGQEHVAEIEKKTAEAIDNEGFLHSGDKGTCSTLNMFRVTGRYKELIIGAGGENIAPVPVEDHIKAIASGVSNVIMTGDKRKFNTALVTLKAEGATGENPGSDNLLPQVHSIGSPGVTKISQAMDDPAWIKHVQDAIEATNNSEICVSNAWKIQKFTILPHDLSINGGELTPTLKTKRAVVDATYKPAIDRMYEDGVKEVYVRYPTGTSSTAAAAAPVTTPATDAAEAPANKDKSEAVAPEAVAPAVAETPVVDPNTEGEINAKIDAAVEGAMATSKT